MNQGQFITENMLEEYGVELNGKDISTFLQHINDTLDERVGTEIAESLDDEKLDELLAVQESGDDGKVGQWIEANVPELQEMVQDEIDILLGELAENADALSASSSKN